MGYHPKYKHLGVTKHGITGLWEQIDHQGLDSYSIAKNLRRLVILTRKKNTETDRKSVV